MQLQALMVIVSSRELLLESFKLCNSLILKRHKMYHQLVNKLLVQVICFTLDFLWESSDFVSFFFSSDLRHWV